MSRFDPYQEWLGIPPDEQPPTYYRLLGLLPFENRTEVIEVAVDQFMATVQSHALGPHTKASQQLLKELAKARLVLLNRNRKREYDAGLRGESVGGSPSRLVSSPANQPGKLQQQQLVSAKPVSIDQSQPSLWWRFRYGFAALGGLMALVMVIVVAWPGLPSKSNTPRNSDGPAASPTAHDSHTSAARGGVVREGGDGPASDIPKSTGVLRGGGVREFNDELDLTVVWCPPGAFTMGSPPNEEGRFENENQVDVTLTQGFWLCQKEVTQRQWKAVMSIEPWRGREQVKAGPDYPASFVSWDDAMAYCRLLTEYERSAGRIANDQEYTLPTEAQWEYACRAGTLTAYSFENSRGGLEDYAWFDANAWDVSEQYAHRVGVKKPNGWNLFDMHGNVYEWCRDTYSNRLQGGNDPIARGVRRERVYRGGSWGSADHFCRSAVRSQAARQRRFAIVGFRVALVSTQPK